MYIIPAIFLSGGNAVSQYKGEIDQVTIMSRDPLTAARKFEKQGAKTIHLVNLDKDLKGRESNRKIAKIIAGNTELFVQYSDGADTLDEIAELFDGGVDFVGLTQFSESLLEPARARFGPEKLFFTILARINEVEGKSGVEVVDYGKDLTDNGVRHIVFRDEKTTGTYHPNYDEIERLVLATPKNTRIFAFGGIGSMKDLELLAGAGASGAIISKAFFENKLSLRECTEKFQNNV